MIDPTSLIPEHLRDRAADGLIEFLAKQAEHLAQDQAADRIRQLSSQADYYQAVGQSIHQGFERFVSEYMLQDEDLAAALQAEPVIWESAEFEKALVDMISRPGAWLVAEQEAITRHFEDILPTRINRERVDKAITYLLRCIAEELWTLPGAREVREVYSLQFQRISAEVAREQTAIARQQLEATTQLSLDMRQALLQLTGAMEQNLLAPPSAGLPTPALPYHNLPQPTYARFVGREQELAWLRERLSPDDRAWQIAITGIGGVGKSALALAIGHEYRQHYDELPESERFDAVIWVSAKEEVLTVQGREQASLPGQVLHTLEDVYTAIAHTLDREDIARATPQEQGNLVDKALRRQRTLIIIDNLESVEDVRIKPFLRQLPLPTKAIVTSREWIDLAPVYPLEGLTHEGGEAFIRGESNIRSLSLTSPQIKRILKLTGGLPLPIKLSLARMAAGESFVAVERWLEKAQSDLPEYCIQGQVELGRWRNPDSWAVLMSCSLFDRESGASRDALGTVGGISPAACDEAIADLLKLYLIEQNESDRFSVLPIVQRFAGTDLNTQAGECIVERWFDWLQSYVEPFASINISGSHRVPSLGTEYPTIRTAIGQGREQQRWELVRRLCEGVWPYTYYTARFTDLDDILDTWLKAAQYTNHRSSLGHAKLHLGRLAWIRRQPEEAIEHLETAKRILQENQDYIELAEAWDTLSQVYESLQQVDYAESYAHKTLELGSQRQDAAIIGLAAERLAAIYCNRGEIQAADKWLSMAESVTKDLVIPRVSQPILFRRAELLILQEKYEQAIPYLERCIEYDMALGGTRYLAADKFYLAQVYLKIGRLQAARQLALEASDIYERIGMTAMHHQAKQFIDKLESESVE